MKKRRGEKWRKEDNDGIIKIFSYKDLKNISRPSLKKTDKFVLQLEGIKPGKTKMDTKAIVSK